MHSIIIVLWLLRDDDDSSAQRARAPRCGSSKQGRAGGGAPGGFAFTKTVQRSIVIEPSSASIQKAAETK